MNAFPPYLEELQMDGSSRELGIKSYKLFALWGAGEDLPEEVALTLQVSRLTKHYSAPSVVWQEQCSSTRSGTEGIPILPSTA